MKKPLNNENRRTPQHNIGGENRNHDEIIRNLQNQIDQTKREIDSLMQELKNHQHGNQDMQKKQQIERRIDELKGMIARLTDDIEREREFEKAKERKEVQTMPTNRRKP